MWVMRLMTRHLSVVARPIIQWVADHEVIACGLRRSDGQVYVIYTPTESRGDHEVFRKRGGRTWEKIDSREVTRFSDPIVRQVVIPDALIGDVLQVRAPLLSRKFSTKQKIVKSPKITVKESSKDISSSLNVREHFFSWDTLEGMDPMIYFLAIEQDSKTQTAIYTRETNWLYPHVESASLSVGSFALTELDERKEHQAKLVVVDYDGWVSGLGQINF